MENKNVEVVSTGLKCDNPKCDWRDETIKVEDWENWINAKCPKCSENILTLEDYNNGMAVMVGMDIMNLFTPEELAECGEGKTIADLKEKYKNVKGVETLTDINGSAILSFDTHKGVKIKEIKQSK